VPLGLLALEELGRRRPGVEIALFGADRPISLPFRHAGMGVLDAPGLARLYAKATVGMVFSLTNPSLIGLEMMACALPCVELATDSMRATWGSDGPLLLAEADPIEICSTIEKLLDDPDLRDRMASSGLSFMEGLTWAKAAEQVEAGLRSASHVER
jgi:glycosyltransferase involved in cell wall biosynthesis